MQVELHPGEKFDSLLKRFGNIVKKDGILNEFCNRLWLATPSARKKFKKEKALARFRKREKIRNSFGG